MAHATVALLFLLAFAACRRASVVADSRPVAYVWPGEYAGREAALVGEFRPTQSLAQDSLRALIVPGEVFDTIGASRMREIFDYYVNGGTVALMHPTSRNWLRFWRKMFAAQDSATDYIPASAADDLRGWRLEAEEVKDCTGDEPMFDGSIGYAVAVRPGDFYCQVDSLNVRNLADWINGTPTQAIVTREYNQRNEIH